MTAERLQGYVIKSVQVTDHKHILTLYSLTRGKCQGVYRVSRASGQAAAYLAPFTCLNFELTGKEQALKTMAHINLESQTFHLSRDYLGLCLLQHWANLLMRSQPEAQSDSRIFRLIGHCLNRFDRNWAASSIPLINLYFETWLLHLCGMLPRIQETDRLETSPEGSRIQLNGRMLVASQAEPAPGDALNFSRIFTKNLEGFAPDDVKCEFLARAHEILGDFWADYVNTKDLNIRNTLVTRLKERRLL